MFAINGDLLFTIVNHGQGERFVELARECGATGATIFPAKGSATNAVLRALGLGETSKDVVLIVANKKIVNQIELKASEDDKLNGVCAVIGKNGEKTMDKTWKMITVIVNYGFSEDVMETARKAGATGGTISHARGTASKEQEQHFMGMTIVPEKEMVYILCDAEKTNDIINAICSMECLKEPGMGIVYTQDVTSFTNLGK